MAERLAEVSARIRDVRQLEAVVTAMRGIAASRAQRARALVAGIDAYSAIVSRAIGQALALLPADFQPASSPRHGQTGLILFCAEQGFAGALSEQVLNGAGSDLSEATAFVIGTRGAAVAAERGLTPVWSRPMATHADAVPSLANDIAGALYAQIAASTLSTIHFIVPRFATGSGISIERQSLLPLDLTRFPPPSQALPPLTTLAPRELLEQLTAEYVYARLCEAAMHAFEAENQARMMTMTSARTNIEAKLVTLAQRERQLRQEEITSEIVELAAGAEASREAH